MSTQQVNGIERNHAGSATVGENQDYLSEESASYNLHALIVLAKHKKFLFKGAIVALLLALAAVFILPKKFKAVTQIMPPQQNQSIASAMLSQIGPLASLIGVGGKDVGSRTTSDLYGALLRSRTVADDLITRFHLLSVYRKNTMEKGRKSLESATEVKISKEGIIEIAVKDRDSNRAMELANGYVDELRKLSQTLAVTEAGHRRIFFESEVSKASADLSKAEVALKEIQEQTGMLHLDSQSKAMIDAYVTLRAQVAAKEAQIEAMRGFATPENPDLIRGEHELSALRNEVLRFEKGQSGQSGLDMPLLNIPKAGLEYIDRLREVKYREALLELLTKQYELARIDEAKDSAIVQVVDKAVNPETQIFDWPTRLFIGGVVLIVALAGAVVGAFVKESLQNARSDKQYSAQLELFKFYLRSGERANEAAAGNTK
jgi:tyrosine-protein kinase Etk/Wzc